MAPETAFVQGGMSSYGSIWGANLPVIQALRDSIEILHVQLYNSGSMYGIDGNIYTQGTADFIVAETEAAIRGFNTAGGLFLGLPASKVAVGLPACTNAAGSGFTDTATVKAAIDYLRGTGPQPGSYVLVQSGGYPDLRGMMTWSVNWDAVAACGASYEYAANYQTIFGSATFVEQAPSSTGIKIYPNPSTGDLFIHTENIAGEMVKLQFYDLLGNRIEERTLCTKELKHSFSLQNFSPGMYELLISTDEKVFSAKVVKM